MKIEMKAELIAPCGINCALCSAYQRKDTHKGYCSGCNAKDDKRKKRVSACKRKICPDRKSGETGFCFECDKFPCKSLKQLDEKYRQKCNVSMIEHLNDIQQKGMAAFLESERIRWTCRECKTADA